MSQGDALYQSYKNYPLPEDIGPVSVRILPVFGIVFRLTRQTRQQYIKLWELPKQRPNLNIQQKWTMFLFCFFNQADETNIPIGSSTCLQNPPLCQRPLSVAIINIFWQFMKLCFIFLYILCAIFCPVQFEVHFSVVYFVLHILCFTFCAALFFVHIVFSAAYLAPHILSWN